jgi:hypothetical protein
MASGWRTGIQKAPSGDSIFLIERRADVVGAKLRLSVGYREDREAVALAQRRARLGTLASQPGKGFADRYAPGFRQRFGQIKNIRFDIYGSTHLDSMMT